jgi:hypothetical protein
MTARMQMCVARGAQHCGRGARAPYNDVENYVVVGRPAAFQAFKPPAIEWTFL